MANTRELRRRIKSVRNTSQITKAMQMVAATKMRKAQIQALAGRPYNQTLNLALLRLQGKVTPDLHPFLRENNSSKIGIVFLTTDKSLCGALNTNLFRLIQQFSSKEIATSTSSPRNDITLQQDQRSVIASLAKQSQNLLFYTMGKKGRDFVVKTGKTLEADFENQEIINFNIAVQIRKLITKDFLEEKVGKIYLLFPDFISTLRQEPKLKQILPIDSLVLDQSSLKGHSGMAASHDKQSFPFAVQNVESKKDTIASLQYDNGNKEIIFEPDPASLLDYTLNHFLDTEIYQALLETKASEHSARMMAMQNATDNAKELVEDLKLTYNQTRQNAITSELLEITSASAALE